MKAGVVREGGREGWEKSREYQMVEEDEVGELECVSGMKVWLLQYNL